jgi:hypothetical protein
MNVKYCNYCKVEKDFSKFYKQQHGKFGLRGRCIECVKSLENKEQNRIKSKKWAKNNPEKVLVNARKYYSKNRDKCILATKQSKIKHYDKHLAYSKEYEAKNKEKRLLKSRNYAKNNPEKVALIVLKRRIKEKQCTPAWAKPSDFTRIYKLRDRLNKEAGYIKYHIDHVIPINAKLATGLHVIQNLKITLATYNMSKQNKYEVTI